MSADMGYVCEGQPAEKRVGMEDGGRLGNRQLRVSEFTKSNSFITPDLKDFFSALTLKFDFLP